MMNNLSDDADDLVQRNVDLEHVANMSYQMHVPDSITVGPNRTRLNQIHEQSTVRMEVPQTIRLDNHHANSNEHLSDYDAPSDDDYSGINHQPVRITDSWHIEPIANLNDQQIFEQFQTLRTRIDEVERNLSRRNARDRIFFSCMAGYILLQAILSFRRSMLN